MSEDLKKRLDELVKEQEILMFNYHRISGAIAILRELINPTEKSESVKQEVTNGKEL